MGEPGVIPAIAQRIGDWLIAHPVLQAGCAGSCFCVIAVTEVSIASALSQVDQQELATGDRLVITPDSSTGLTSAMPDSIVG